MSQNDIILEHLKSGKSISAREASKLYDIDRLSARIHNLRYKIMFFGIKAEIITIITESKNGKRFAKYLLERL